MTVILPETLRKPNTEHETRARSIARVVGESFPKKQSLLRCRRFADAYPLMDQVAAREGWDDPSMDIYDEFQPGAE